MKNRAMTTYFPTRTYGENIVLTKSGPHQLRSFLLLAITSIVIFGLHLSAEQPTLQVVKVTKLPTIDGRGNDANDDAQEEEGGGRDESHDTEGSVGRGAQGWDHLWAAQAHAAAVPRKTQVQGLAPCIACGGPAVKKMMMTELLAR